MSLVKMFSAVLSRCRECATADGSEEGIGLVVVQSEHTVAGQRCDACQRRVPLNKRRVNIAHVPHEVFDVRENHHGRLPTVLRLLPLVEPRRRAEGQYDGDGRAEGGHQQFPQHALAALHLPELGHSEFHVHNPILFNK